jgi:prolyl-tRNA synthetase
MHKSYRVREVAEKIYQQLLAANIEVLFDDRKERAGVIFADMDLIGIPHRIIISESGLENNTVEYKHRIASATEYVNIDTLEVFIKNKVKNSW